MRFGLLGPLAVDVAGRRLEISAARDRVVLAMLLLEPNRVVTLARLIDAVWGDATPVTARAQLHTCVSRLRRHLPGLIHTDTAGYRAAVAADDLDTLRFDRLTAAGRAAIAAGDLTGARARLRDALGLWRGPALVDIDSPGVQAAAVALQERHHAALEDCIDVELRLGLQAELISRLTALAEQHPLRERLHGQLMTALARVGRSADAVAVYRRLATTLDEQLGLAPGAEVQQVYRELLRPQPAAPTTRRAAAGPSSPWTLPRDVADFSGRDDVVARLVAAAADPAVLTVDGMAGVGKTTVAVHVAHLVADRYPDGRLLIDLRAHGERPPLSPHSAAEILLRHLGLDPAGIPQDPAERFARWRGELADRRLLVILDNAADPAQIAPLLPAPGGASLVVVTSRRRLATAATGDGISLDVLGPGDAARFVAAVVGGGAGAAPAAPARGVARGGGGARAHGR
ncbi:BTAD domain-containing putative transcriptional regulator, partial [Dactylosporangium sp. NPDC051485]|uniref:AfsR/SARP family transcriptional regulator n=1 Tax=Dactylosporangium sp. NPDC051485 TaxID=3154846 RepID=UPI003438B423